MRHYVKFPRALPRATYYPPAVFGAYGFPKGTTPPFAGVDVAVIELGGGHNLNDIKAAFAAYGQPAPTVKTVAVQGAFVAGPGDPANAEVMLDILIAASAVTYVTGRPANIAVVYAPNTDAGFAAALAACVTMKPAAVSISWGAPEDEWSASARKALGTQVDALNALGIPVFAASGDNDYTDGGTGANVDFPASYPGVIGCGGTSLLSLSPLSERVWNDGQGDGSGGGYSVDYAAPSWQVGVPGGRGRMVPDVAGAADPATGWRVIVDGSWRTVGGTSAVAPMWAGLAAGLKAAGADISNLSKSLWAHAPAFHDITTGDNGFYKATLGPDPCTGLGTPDGNALLAALAGGVSPPPPPPPVPPPPPTPPPNPPGGIMSFLKLLQAVLAFIAKWGAVARPIIEMELSAMLAAGTITKAQYDAIEAVLNLILGAAKPAADGPTAEEFRALLLG